MQTARFAAIAAVLFLAPFAGCESAPSETTPATGDAAASPADRPAGPAVTEMPLDDGTHISGPYTHENMSVFLVHAAKRDERPFLTLDEGLADGRVKITEKDSEQVSELMIANASDLPLFLQEGDRLVGGKQDRTIVTSMVVPPKSGPMPVPTMCVEESRWTEGDKGREFAASSNHGFAGKDVRYAAKVASDQGKVWQNVAREKAKLVASLEVQQQQTSSLNEALDSEKVIEATKPFVKALGEVAREHEDAVGVVFVVNGKIEEASAYPGNGLLAKVFPRLLESYAIQACASRPEAEVAGRTAADVVAFMTRPAEVEAKEREIDGKNLLRFAETEKKAACSTYFEDFEVHRQMLAR